MFRYIPSYIPYETYPPPACVLLNTAGNFFEGVLWLEEEVSSELTRSAVALLDTTWTILTNMHGFPMSLNCVFPRVFPFFPVITVADDSLGQRTKIPPNLRDSGETAFLARGKPRSRHNPLKKRFPFCDHRTTGNTGNVASQLAQCV